MNEGGFSSDLVARRAGNNGRPVSRSNRNTCPDLVRDCIHALAMTHDFDEGRRRRQSAIPQIVPQGFKMPDAFAGVRLQRQQAVGIQIAADAIRAVEIEGRRTGSVESPSENRQAGGLSYLAPTRMPARHPRRSQGDK